MKLFHLSDLHIGKNLHGFSLIEDQIYILDQILELIKERKPDAVLIAGDIYDKSAPSAEAVAVLDEFLTGLANIPNGPVVCMISGNHDSEERLSFGSRLFADHKIYIAGNAPGREKWEVQKVVISDAFGEVTVYMLPFFRPAYVREIPGMEDVKSYEDAMRALVKGLDRKDGERTILLCHQFFTNNGRGPERSDSETIQVGGQDNIDCSAVADFSYVAAGHIHRPQTIGRGADLYGNGVVRYCGSPLKYSVSEAGWDKSVTEVEINGDGAVDIKTIPLVPQHDVRKIQGTLAELTSSEVLAEANPEDYVSIILTDEEELFEPGQTLARVYPRMLEWRVENARTRYEMQDIAVIEEKKSILEMFGDFYEQMRGIPLNEKQTDVMKRIVRTVGGDVE